MDPNYLQYWSTIDDDDLVCAATRKLLCGDALNPRNDEHVLAVFSNRMLVELAVAESETPTRLAINGVRSHMRTLMGVIEQSAIASRVLSEPPLAIAAAHALSWGVESYATALKTFNSKLIRQGLVIDTGTKGELVSRMLWIMARDAVYMDERTVSASGYGSVSASTSQPMIEPVTLRSILEKLLGFEVARPVGYNRTETHYYGGDLRLYAVQVYVNFTHFVKMTRSIGVVTAEFLYSLWCRGAAVQCAEDQPIFDGFFVTYRGDLKEPFDAKKLSYVVWKTRARTAAASSLLEEELTGPVIEGGGPESPELWKPEHVAIFMDLCTTERFAENDRYCKISYSPAKQPTASKGTNRPTWTGYVGTDEPSRYCINIRGLSIYEILWSPYGMVDMSFVLRQRAGVHTGLKKYASKFYEQIGDMEDGNIGRCAGE